MRQHEDTHLVKEVSHPFGYHQYDHDGEAKTDASGCLDQDDGQTDGHSHHAACIDNTCGKIKLVLYMVM